MYPAKLEQRQMCIDSEVRERAKRMYEFVKELILLRQIPVRNYTNYDVIVALDDLPPAPDALFAARGDFNGMDDDSWIEVRCPPIERYPEPPEALRDWLDPSQLGDAAGDAPELQLGTGVAGRSPEASEGDESDEEESVRGANGEPTAEVQATWEAYVEREWWPWAERSRPKFRAKRLYDDLFRMFQRQEHLGETYEVIVGLGLLSWKPPTQPIEIRRHLVAVPLSIDLDSRRQILSLRPAPTGVDVRLEEEMIDSTLRPPAHIRSEIKAGMTRLENSIWTEGHLHDLLQAYCHALGPEAHYDRSGPAPKLATDVPSVTFTPTVILRRRGTEGMAGFVEQIIRAINDGAEIPPAVLRQVWVDDTAPAHGRVADEDDSDGEVYFPLPANREQLRIVERLNAASGVVVEGPPGTGKSQTIANLVCHLLARGKRVLVTSQTARALQVLRDKIPEPIRPLCVQALSNDRKGMEALEYSVRGIADRHLSWLSEQNEAAIHWAEEELGSARERLRTAISDQRTVREAETRCHERISGRYSGTLAQIARQIRAEGEEYGLIRDEVPLVGVPPLTPESFDTAVGLLATDPSVLEAGAGPEPTATSALIEPSALQGLVDRARELGRLVAASSDDRCGGLASRLKELSPEVRSELKSLCDGIALPLLNLLRLRPEEWLVVAAGEVLAGRDGRWKSLQAATADAVAKLKSVPRAVIEARVSGHEGSDVDGIKHRVDVLRRRMAERRGRRLGFRLFQPPPVRRALDSLAKVRVDGAPATEREPAATLAAWAEAQLQLASLDAEWRAVAEVPRGSIRARIVDYESNCQPLERLLELAANALEVRKQLDRYELPCPRWHDPDDVDEYRRAFELAEALCQLGEAKRSLDECSQRLLDSARCIGDTETRSALENAVRERDVAKYRAAYAHTDELHAEWERRRRAELAVDALRREVPGLMQEVQENPSSPRWRLLSGCWEEAWAWASTRTWLVAMTAPDAERKVALRIADEQRRIDELLAELAAKKAWGHCLREDRLTEPRRQALIAWLNAVKRIGKGTGKYADQHRRAAREHIGNCQPAIPAWIMPLYRVAESVPVSQTRFDVAIIDEASQSGPEALAVLFIADKIVVVGDAQQISPDPFTKVEDVNRLRRELIPDIPANDALDPENSLFDLAMIRFPDRVRLVEHFRCMPEIIQFSNDLCYRSEPLLPLRQFGAGRLEPVVSAVHVPNGYTTGKTQKVNGPEAVAVARKVVELTREKRYDGKTFGVISLLGQRHAQRIERELESLMEAKTRSERMLICGDAYDFQGDERDVMMLSLVAAPSCDQPIRPLSDPKGRDTRRYNVAMSRARDQVWLFHSPTLNDLSPNDLRHQLLGYCQNPGQRRETMAGIDLPELRRRMHSATRALDRQPAPFDSWFEVEVFLRIADEGFTVIPQYEVSGYSIDLAVIGRTGKLAVECDGEYWHGPERWESDASRQRDLERCGWPFFRIREAAFVFNPEAALGPLWDELRRHGIGTTEEPPPADPTEGSDGASGADAPQHGREASTAARRSSTYLCQDESLPPYLEWDPRAVPNPRTASREAVVAALCEIVKVEGPVTWRRAFDRYRIALQLGRLKGPTREALDSAARAAVRAGKLSERKELLSGMWEDTVVRAPGSASVRLRQRGPRQLEDVPPSEIAELMRRLNVRAGDEESAFRRILACYGLQRLTEAVTKHLRSAVQLCD